MKQYDHVFGVDVSKKTVDITHVINQEFTHRQFSNDEAGMEQLMDWLKDLKLEFDTTLFCMEATGLYCFPLTRFLAAHSIDIWIEHAAQIKKATALIRGKNDKVDSQRIAVYATKNLDQVAAVEAYEYYIREDQASCKFKRSISRNKKEISNSNPGI